MPYEINTPLCVEATELARELAQVADTPTQKLGAARIMLSALSHDIKARLAQPKIRAYEAKEIENEDRRAISSGGEPRQVPGPLDPAAARA